MYDHKYEVIPVEKYNLQFIVNCIYIYISEITKNYDFLPQSLIAVDAKMLLFTQCSLIKHSV